MGSGGNFAELETPLMKEQKQDMFRELPVFGFRGRESETRERERGLVKSVQDVSKPEPKIPFLISYK